MKKKNTSAEISKRRLEKAKRRNHRRLQGRFHENISQRIADMKTAHSDKPCPCNRPLTYAECCQTRDRRTPRSEIYGFVQIRLGAGDLGLPCGNLESVKQKLSMLPRDSTLLALQKINIGLSSRKPHDQIDLVMAREFLPGMLLKQIEAYAHKKRVSVAIFSKQQICLLTHLMQVDDLPSAQLAQPEEYSTIFGTALLEINDVIAWSIPSQKEPETLSLIEKDLIFNNTDQVRYLIPRSILFYKHLARKNQQHHDFVDIDDQLVQLYGFGVDDLQKALTMVWLYYSRQKFENWSPIDSVIDLETFFAKVDEPSRYERVLKFFAAPFGPRYSGVNSDLSVEARLRLCFEFFDLRQKPFAQLDGSNKAICLSVPYLAELIWTGVYYLMLSHPTSSIKQKFQRFQGILHEDYCQSLARFGFGDRFSIRMTPFGNPLNDGVIELAPGWQLIIEMKAARISSEMVSGLSSFSDTASFTTRIAKGIDELSKRIEEHRAGGYTGRITPCIIASGMIPQHVNLWSRYMASLNAMAQSQGLNISVLRDIDCDFPLVLDLEDWEMLTALASKGADIAKILSLKYSRSDWTQGHLQTLLFQNRHTNSEVTNEALISLYKSFTQEIFRLFDGQGSGEIVGGELWREVFAVQ